ncbi:MAG: acyl-CoA/acyl-ACP dehydrogenase [Planctomycetia bacterium]|nr:acyl-CoA/acyl-ACP dehydrogenase [Planctomycetia bacterium]
MTSSESNTALTATELDRLVALLSARADETDRAARWPAEQLRACAEAGILSWFAQSAEADAGDVLQAVILRTLTRLASGCLTTAFCLTQPAGVVARLVVGENEALRRRLLPDLIAGRTFGSVGIAQLTTSRRHVQPPMKARETSAGYVLDGVIPWVTGGARAQWIITGAVLDDGRQWLGVLPTDRPGVVVEPAAEMVGLTATHTGPVRCDGVVLGPEWLLAPVVPDVLKHGKGAGTGGLQTSALALGTALAAIDYLADEAGRRSDLQPIVADLREQWQATDQALVTPVENRPGGETNDDVRHRANGLALRSAQAALAAAKGSGYVVGHPAGRWCREALFFLVWSCPQPVVQATLCELARR